MNLSRFVFINQVINKKILIRKRNYIRFIEKNKKHLFVDIRKKLFYILLKLVVIPRRKKRGRNINILREFKLVNGPIIFCVSHTGADDIEIIYETSKVHSILLTGEATEKVKFGTLDDAFLSLVGCIYVDRQDKNDRKVSKQMLESWLLSGENIMIFPEGTWNLSPNRLLLNMSAGVIDIAKNTKATLIPVITEINDNNYSIYYGEAFNYNNFESSIEAICELRDFMATIKWEILESRGHELRERIEEDFWIEYLRARVSEFPSFNIYDERICEFKYNTFEENLNVIEQFWKKI